MAGTAKQFEEYVQRVEDGGEVVAGDLRLLWNTFLSKLSDADLPRSSIGGMDTLVMQFESADEKRIVDVDMEGNGAYEWFSMDRETGKTDGGGDDGTPIGLDDLEPIKQALRWLRA